jgi:hypothetical protein
VGIVARPRWDVETSIAYAYAHAEAGHAAHHHD